MPRTRQRQSLNGSHAEEHNESITMSRDNFTALLTTIQQSNAEVCERMLERLSTTAFNLTASPAPTPSAAEKTGNFARCSSRFSGSAKENVETFIDAIEAYKECTNTYDDVAIKGMSMLLTNEAATWWQSIRSEVTSWKDVIQYLRDAYGDRRPEHKIFRELFKIEQAEDVRTDIFVAKSRALMSRLPASDLSLKVQLDMVYGLLHRKIRKRLRREEVCNFSELLNKSRIIEETIAESTKSETLNSAPIAAQTNAAKSQPAMHSEVRAEPHGETVARCSAGNRAPHQARARPIPARAPPRDDSA
uniref:Ty3 transposon capsid-like protein domain-containing protein n=1 Tax=Heliothis virescens TaxID=7102 RepID=A0A2A4JQ27_HELVI